MLRDPLKSRIRLFENFSKSPRAFRGGLRVKWWQAGRARTGRPEVVNRGSDHKKESPADSNRSEYPERNRNMNVKKTIFGSLLKGCEDAAARNRRERSRVVLGIERHEDRVVLSRMGMPGGFGGMPGGFGGGFEGGQAADVSSYDTQGGMMGRGGPGGMMMGRGQFGPMRGQGGMGSDTQSGDSTTPPALPAGAPGMASLSEGSTMSDFTPASCVELPLGR